MKTIIDSKVLAELLPGLWQEETVKVLYKDGFLQIGHLDAFEVHSQNKNDWMTAVDARSLINLRDIYERYGHQPIVVNFSESHIEVSHTV